MWKVKPFLWFEIVVWDIVWPLLSIALMIVILIQSFFNPAIFFLAVIPSLIGVVVIRNLPVVLFNSKTTFSMTGFSFLATFVMSWQTYTALLTVRRSSWGTR